VALAPDDVVAMLQAKYMGATKILEGRTDSSDGGGVISEVPVHRA
jgi:hypothetical protein